MNSFKKHTLIRFLVNQSKAAVSLTKSEAKYLRLSVHPE